jgi:hypothetical protein
MKKFCKDILLLIEKIIFHVKDLRKILLGGRFNNQAKEFNTVFDMKELNMKENTPVTFKIKS